MNSFLNYQRKHLVLFKQQAMNNTFYKRISVTSSILKTNSRKIPSVWRRRNEKSKPRISNMFQKCIFKYVYSIIYLFLAISDFILEHSRHTDTNCFCKKKCVLSFFYELYCKIYEIDFYLCDGMLQAWFEKWHDQLNTSIVNMTDDKLYTQYMYWKYC